MPDEIINKKDAILSPLSPSLATNAVMAKVSLEQELYKKNVELDSVNDLLSLTRELYKISLLSLDPAALADKITTTMRDSLHLEMSGIFLFDRQKDSLEPLAFSKSERLLSVLRKSGYLLRDVSIPKITKSSMFKNLFEGQFVVTENLNDIWGTLIREDVLKEISTSANVKMVIVYPLLTEERVIGAVLLGYTSRYDELSKAEKDSFKSFADVIAVALDKAYTYQDLDTAKKSAENLYMQMVEANKKLKTVDETKSTILSFASHYLQNPIQNIVMGSSMMVDGSFGVISEQAKKASIKMFESARHLSLTVKMWLKALDFEENHITYKKEKFDISVLANNLLKDWNDVAQERSIVLSFETDNKPPYMVEADQSWIRDVIANIYDNALKMTEKGFIKVKVEKNDSEKIRFSVTDSGAGIDNEMMTKLFQKFERGSAGWKKDVDGTGLGLYICKKIIEEGHHGKIWAESAGLGKGATFYFELDATN